MCLRECVLVCSTCAPPVLLRRFLDENQLSGTLPNSIGSMRVNLNQLYVIVAMVVIVALRVALVVTPTN